VGCFDREPEEGGERALLALTENAVHAVKGLVSSSDETAETGGLRMVAEQAGEQVNFQLSLAALPAEDDEVIEQEGARLFLNPEASSLLEDKLLDANVDRDQVAFTLAERPD
jgi:iron-sulfur cluster assembly protein